MKQEYETFQNHGDQGEPFQQKSETYNIEDWEQQLEAQLHMAGRVVEESMSFGLDQMDRAFQNMKQWDHVEDRLRFAAERVQSGLERAQMYTGKTVSIHLDNDAQTFRKNAGDMSKPGRNLLRAAQKRQILGGLECFFGGSMTFAFGISFFTLMDWWPGLSSAFLFVTIFSLVLLGFGVRNLGVARFVRTLARAARKETVLPVEYLAEDMQMPPKRLRSRLNRYTRSGKLPAWLNRDKTVLYLDADSWRAARDEAVQEEKNSQKEEARQTEAKEQPEKKEPSKKDPLVEMRSFVEILKHESSMMSDDAQAVQELQQLTETSQKILEWASKHPESLPKLRHLREQYIPMTLKLLYTYNDLKIQDSDNAVHVRQDIAGMLHTLNQGFSALLDQLLDAVAMDVTGDIAALQGMLAWDGLTEEKMFHE